MTWLVWGVVVAIAVVSFVYLLRRGRTPLKSRNPQVDRAFEDARARVRKNVDSGGPGGTFGPGAL